MAHIKKCTCKEWIENIKKVDISLNFYLIEKDKFLIIEPFKYCPYRGKEIK